jgi:hypothetical protein
MLGRTFLILVMTVLLVGVTACASGGFDSGDNADVLLQVTSVIVPPVTASIDPLNPGICLFTITEATATLVVEPKVEGDGFSPANDVLITQLTVSYAWDDGVVTPPFVTSPRVTIPAGTSGSVFFLAIPLDDLLNAAVPRDGHSAELTFLFDGRTESNARVQAVGGAALIVNECQ